VDTYSSVNDYKKLEVTSTNRLKLIVMVYDAAIAALKQATECHMRNDQIKRNRYISRAQLIITELNNALNMEQGKEISDTLSKIYFFLNRHLKDVLSDNNIHRIEQSVNILTNLREAWTEIGAKSEENSADTQTTVSAAANSGLGNTFYG